MQRNAAWNRQGVLMAAIPAIDHLLNPDYRHRIRCAGKALHSADYILIGGGAGLSDAAGLCYSGRRFTDNFAPFIATYGFDDLYTSSFFHFNTSEEKWAYWAKHISINRYEASATALYRDLFHLVDGKRYFVLTTNVDDQFRMAGFPEDRVFSVQGDYGYFQCATACHHTLYGNQVQIAEMVRQMEDCRIPSELVPRCPVCNGEMDVNVNKDPYFVRDTRWHDSERRYRAFLRGCARKKVVFLELGVGFNTPGIIRFPFEALVHANPDAVLIRVNRDHARGFAETDSRTIAFTEDMAQVLQCIQEKP
jgi:NAD-dependent SIR2 family protein deacetylase